MKTSRKTPAVATLTVRGLPKMTKGGVYDIADWLRDVADELEDRSSTDFASVYTCHYLVAAK